MAVVSVGNPPSAPPRRATARDYAVFDLDRTLLPGSSLGRFARRLVEEGLVRRRDIARHALHEGLFAAGRLGPAALERIGNRIASAAAGHHQADIATLARTMAPAIVADFFPAAAWLVEQHQRLGDRTVLLSAAPQELVDAVARHVGLEVALGTTAETVGGCYTGRLAGPFCHGGGKVTRLRSVLGPIELRRTSAYADSASDLPLLRAVQHPVAVNPDRTLAAAAARGGWPVLHFR